MLTLDTISYSNDDAFAIFTKFLAGDKDNECV